MGTPLGPKYIPYTYMDPLGISIITAVIISIISPTISSIYNL